MNAMTVTMPTAEAPAATAAAPAADRRFDLGAPAAPRERDHSLAPLKPSAEMLIAGARASGVSVEVVWKIYHAMLKEAA